MPDISFQDLGTPNTLPLRFWNMIVERTPQGPTSTRRIPRPGLVETHTLGTGPIRATFKFQTHRITVSGGAVYFDAAHVGNVPVTGGVRFAVSDDECVVVVNRRAYYITDAAVALITDPDLPQVIDVLYIAGRFVYIHAASDGEFSWSATNDARNVDGLAFASAESSPDRLTGGLVIGDNILFVGEKTGEWWYPADDINAPFQRSRGRRYDKGSLAIRSIILADNNGYWVGDDRIIYKTSQVPLRVSDSDMEARLKLLSDAELARVSAYRVIYSGHTFYVVNLPRLGTWALDIGMKNWSRWTTWMKDRFRVDVCDDDILGDAYTGRLMRFDPEAFADMEDSIERVTACYLPVNGGVQRNTNLVLHCSRGVGLPTGYGQFPKVEMRYSDHEGADFTNWMEAELGAIGDRSKAAMAHWVGLGSFQAPGRLFEFRCTDPVYFSCFKVAYNEQRP